VLQALDPAALLLKLFDEFLTLGAKEFVLLAKCRELGVMRGGRVGTFRGHVLIIQRTKCLLERTLRILRCVEENVTPDARNASAA
jgi:hypothetical protein